MRSLAQSSIAPVLGQRIPFRGPARALHRSFSKSPSRPDHSAKILATKFGDRFNVDLSSFLEWQLWVFGAYEEHLAELFRHLIRPGDRCIDVGANIGVHTIRLAKLVGTQGEVIALEPDEELAHRISVNLALNYLTNVQIIQAAASERGGDSVMLHRPDAQDSNKGRASLLPHSYLTGSKAKVATTSIDDIAHGPVALIKIDVEGFEAPVVAGATRTIDTFLPSIIFEYDSDMLLNGLQSPFEWLEEKGYGLLGIRRTRHRLTGRGGLRLERLRTLPTESANILAVSRSMFSRVSSLIG